MIGLRSLHPSSCSETTRKPAKQNYSLIRDLMATLADDPRPSGCRKLVGREGWRIRSGVYRVIYEIDDVQRRVTILDIGHRKDIYG